MTFRFPKSSIVAYLTLLISCNPHEIKSRGISENDTLGILKSSLDSSLVYVKATRSQRSADTAAFTSEFRLDTVMRAYFSRDTLHKLKYLKNDSLCRLAHVLMNKEIQSYKVTNLLAFGRDSVGDYRVVLERDRLITTIRVIKGDTIRSCEFGGGVEWTMFLLFRKTANVLQPKVEYWEIH